jgi:hypothetical protein
MKTKEIIERLKKIDRFNVLPYESDEYCKNGDYIRADDIEYLIDELQKELDLEQVPDDNFAEPDDWHLDQQEREDFAKDSDFDNLGNEIL